jgi:HKD family nuclease
MNVEFHSEVPDRPLAPRIAELITGATRVDIAVAFVTDYGARTIREIASKLKGGANVRLIVSALFPTDLASIKELAAQNVDVWVHRGRLNKAEELHWQFHSKVVFIEGEGQWRTIIVGSHNWTQNGLNGGNLEASLVVECVEGDSVVKQTRKHIEACKQLSEPFDAANLPLYEEIQRQFHPKLESAKGMNFPGFARFEGVVILAENHAQHLAGSGRLFFHIQTEDVDYFRFGTHVSVFVFPLDQLFDGQFPLPAPLEFAGNIETNDGDRDRPPDVGPNAYLIKETDCPFVEEIVALPPLPRGRLLISIPFTKVAQQESLPLFHAAHSLRPTIEFDTLPEHEVYANDEQINRALSEYTGEETTPRVPTRVLAETKLRVPFRELAYPPTLRSLLEAFALRKGETLGGVPYSVKFDRPTMITEYICYVRYRSDKGLAEAIRQPTNMGD